MELIYGTRDEHLATLRRAKNNGLASVWSGDVRRNPYLRENLAFAESEGIVELESYDNAEAQESGWNITWLKTVF